MLKPTSPKRVFATRIERLQLSWLALPPSNLLQAEDDVLLRRLCTDDRMHEAWELLTTFNDDEFAGFIEEALLVVAGVRALPELKEHHRWRRNEIDEACEKTKQFIEVCETLPVFLSAWEMMSFVRDSRATLGDYFPELLARAREAYLALLAEAANAKAERKDDIGDLSRKFGDGRQEMARDLTLLIRRITGQPHYEAIAALLNVILDTADHNMISADAVRKAVARGSDYSAA